MTHYHVCSHKEVPWKKSSKTQDEEYNPHTMISGKSNNKTNIHKAHHGEIIQTRTRMEVPVYTHLSLGALMAVIFVLWLGFIQGLFTEWHQI